MSAWHGVPRVEEIGAHTATMHEAYMYARRYMDGRYFPFDLKLARKWLLIADNLGYPNINRDLYELDHKIFVMEGVHHLCWKEIGSIIDADKCREVWDEIKKQIESDHAREREERQKIAAANFKKATPTWSRKAITDPKPRLGRLDFSLPCAPRNPRDIEKIIFSAGHHYGSRLFQHQMDKNKISLLQCCHSDKSRIAFISKSLIETVFSSRKKLIKKMIYTIRSSPELSSYNGSLERMYAWMVEGIEEGIHRTELQIYHFIESRNVNVI